MKCQNCAKEGLIYDCYKCDTSTCRECFEKYHTDNKLYDHSFICIPNREWKINLQKTVKND